MIFVFTDLMSPTKPRSTGFPFSSRASSFSQTLTRLPGMPTGTPLRFSMSRQMSALISLLSVFSTILIVCSSVTRMPLRHCGLTAAFSIARVIAFPPPWTTTTLMPTELRKTMSDATRSRAAGSSESMKLPPYLTTKTESWKRWMYGSASSRTPALEMSSASLMDFSLIIGEKNFADDSAAAPSGAI